jgi:hypothetical protein
MSSPGQSKRRKVFPAGDTASPMDNREESYVSSVVPVAVHAAARWLRSELDAPTIHRTMFDDDTGEMRPWVDFVESVTLYIARTHVRKHGMPGPQLGHRATDSMWTHLRQVTTNAARSAVQFLVNCANHGHDQLDPDDDSEDELAQYDLVCRKTYGMYPLIIEDWHTYSEEE